MNGTHLFATGDPDLIDDGHESAVRELGENVRSADLPDVGEAAEAADQGVETAVDLTPDIDIDFGRIISNVLDFLSYFMWYDKGPVFQTMLVIAVIIGVPLVIVGICWFIFGFHWNYRPPRP